MSKLQIMNEALLKICNALLMFRRFDHQRLYASKNCICISIVVYKCAFYTVFTNILIYIYKYKYSL